MPLYGLWPCEPLSCLDDRHVDSWPCWPYDAEEIVYECKCVVTNMRNYKLYARDEKHYSYANVMMPHFLNACE